MRRLLPFTTTLMILVALWTAWTFYSRRQNASEAERESQEERERKRTHADQNAIKSFGGDQFTIIGFNAAEHQIAPGGRALLCYGVSNATSVEIKPEVEPVKPALSHCLDVFPKQTTTYTLKATDGKGNTKTASLTIQVGAN